MKQPDPDTIFLMDKCKAITGSDTATARALGLSNPESLYNWRAGRTCPAKYRALMANLLGMDALAELARATVKENEGTATGDALMRALGKPSRVTGAVAGFVGAAVLAIFGLITPTRTDAGTLATEHNR